MNAALDDQPNPQVLPDLPEAIAVVGGTSRQQLEFATWICENDDPSRNRVVIPTIVSIGMGASLLLRPIGELDLDPIDAADEDLDRPLRLPLPGEDPVTMRTVTQLVADAIEAKWPNLMLRSSIEDMSEMVMTGDVPVPLAFLYTHLTNPTANLSHLANYHGADNLLVIDLGNLAWTPPADVTLATLPIAPGYPREDIGKLYRLYSEMDGL